MMSHQEVGVFILVLANAISRPEIHRQLADALAQRFHAIQQGIDSMSAAELQKIAPDDLSVFRALSQIDYPNLALASHRSMDQWQLQYNPLRSFRPARNSQQKIDSLYQPFDQHSFHFNKGFLSKEILWQGEVAGQAVRLLYNKFPFADYHGLLLINPEQQNPQFLQQRDCQNMQSILQQLGAVDGIGLAYNSIGAYASVNHQHWQLFVTQRPYPVEHAGWSHNTGSTDYPIEVKKFHSLIEAWPQIDACQRSNCGFNLLLRGNAAYLVARRIQGQYDHSDWTGGFAWSEVMGNIMSSSRDDFERLSPQDIAQELQRLAI